MGKEIEKKYLLLEDSVVHATQEFLDNYGPVMDFSHEIRNHGVPIRQGYLPLEIGSKLAKNLKMDVDFEPKEARIRAKGKEFFFTLKGEGGLERNELEKQIYKPQFDAYWSQTEGRRVEKFRLSKKHGIYIAEFDIYGNRCLMNAEIEVPTIKEANDLVALGKDITEDKSYKNKNLAK